MASLVETVLSRLRRLREWSTPTGRGRKVAAVLVLVGLVIASVVAVRSLPDDAAELTLWPVLILATVAVPLLVAVNMAEFGLAVRMVGADVGRRDQLRISVQAMAANLLPLPGAALVRLNALRLAQTPLERATRALVAIGIGWLATALAIAGAVVVSRQVVLGLLFLAAAVVGMVVVALMVRNLGGPPILARLAAIEIAAVALAAARLWLAFQALGFDVGAAEAAALSASGAIAAAVGFLPGGLGLQEAIATALAPAVGVSAAETFLAATLERAVGVVALLPVAVLALYVGRRRTPPVPASGLPLERAEPLE